MVFLSIYPPSRFTNISIKRKKQESLFDHHVFTLIYFTLQTQGKIQQTTVIILVQICPFIGDCFVVYAINQYLKLKNSSTHTKKKNFENPSAALNEIHIFDPKFTSVHAKKMGGDMRVHSYGGFIIFTFRPKLQVSIL